MQAEVFTKPGCPYCVAAKQLLVKKNIHYVERDITEREHWDDIKERLPGFRTVPQIFLDRVHIGGFDDLVLYLRRSTGEPRHARAAPKGGAHRLAHFLAGKGRSDL